MLPGTTGMHYRVKSAEQLQLHESDHESAFVLKKKQTMDGPMDGPMDGNVPLANGDISTFLSYANVSQTYRDVLIAAGISKVGHLKDAVEEDYLEYGNYVYYTYAYHKSA